MAHPGGRPKRELDQRAFEKLCMLQCTEAEICSFFDCDDKLLTRWCKRTYKKGFAEVYDQKRQGGLTSVRRAQFKQAETNPTMAIWLGKQYLGQTDKVENHVELATESFLDALKSGLETIGDDMIES